MKKIRIDPHVHCRDGNQAYKDTIEHVLWLANKKGVGIIFDMPNTDPPITTGLAVAERMKLVPRGEEKRYFVWLGLTSDPEQIKLAVRSYRNNKHIIGFKLYAGKSVRDLAVIDLENQRLVYEILAEEGYEGVLAVHCEREDLLRPNLWNPHNPMSHSRVRPKEAEIQAVKDQICFAQSSGFKGTLHVVHVSCPESVVLIKQAKEKGARITCGVTPHHLRYEDKIQAGHQGGRMWIMNPPLRSRDDIQALKYCLLRGEIDWVETDHAPHSVGEKLFKHLSGFPSLWLYRELVEDFLPKAGASGKLIREITFENIVKVFENKLGGVL